MMRSGFALAVAVLCVSAVSAQTPKPPRLLVTVSIDALSPELIAEYRPQLSGGLAKLLALPGGAGVAGPGQTVTVSGSTSAESSATGGRHWNWNGRGFAAGSAGAAVPRSVPVVNTAVQKLVGTGEPPLVPPSYCEAKQQAGGARFARTPGDQAAFANSPSLDGATLALAAGLVGDLALGRDAAPDVLAIDLAATGNVIRSHGTASEALCLHLFALDRELGGFLRALDAMKLDYSVQLNR